MTNDWNPSWGQQGKYLYFLSDRHFNPSLGTFDMTYNYHRAGVYVVNLAKDVPALFPLRSDEVKVDADNEKESKKDKKEEKTPEVKIDFGGIQNRMVALPIDADNYRSLHAAGSSIFYVSYPTSGMHGKVEPVESILHGFNLEKRKDIEIAKPVNCYDISPDKKYLIFKTNGEYKITEARADEPSPEATTLDLGGLEAKVDYSKEWREIFDEAWRYQRDYFYNPLMNNVNWDSMKVKYGQLVPYVADRYDLNYVIGEMIGELSNSHTYVGGGDYPDIKTTKYGQLGVDLMTEDGFYKITKIYPGDNTRKSRQSPLTKPGVNIPVGSYIIAIDGKPIRAGDNFNRLLENKVGKQVKLTVNDKPSSKGARDVTVKPVGSEYQIRHWDWINSNREKVSKMSNGEIGYIYLTDMSATGLNEFVEQYYPQIRKDGLIIDVRYNGGGFVDQLILERLRRILISMDVSRQGTVSTVPEEVFTDTW